MRIMHFSQSLPGGPASYIEEIARWQIDLFGRENVRFVLPAAHRDHVPSVPDDCFIGFSSKSRSPTALLAVGRFAQNAIREFKPDVVHLHSTFAGALGRLPAILSRPQYKIVYCAHGWAFAGRGGPLASALYAGLERWLADFSDAIINISSFEQQAALRRGLPANKMTVVHNGIARSCLRDADVPSICDPDKINLLFVGRHDPQKGLDILLEAMQTLNRDDVHLHILGAPVVARHAPPRPFLVNVTFHDWLPRGRVFQLMAMTDGVVVPSRWEAFGLVAIEAMRLGKPVIASRVGALSEIVKDGETGILLSTNTARNLASVIDRLHLPAMVAMGERARARFLKRFTADHMNRSIAGIYQMVAAQKAPGRQGQQTYRNSVSLREAPL